MAETPTLDDLVELAGEVLESDEVEQGSNWFGLGGDSLSALQFSILIEETWGYLVDVADITDAADFSELHRSLIDSRTR